MFDLVGVLAERSIEYNNFSSRPEFTILTVLSGVAAHHGKNYCFPAQEKILGLLSRYGVRMSRRTLNRHLNALERSGWIKRQRRHHVDPRHGMTFRSSLYTFTKRTFRWLSGLAAAVKKAVGWGGSFSSNSRVPNLAQHIPYRESYTGGAPPKAGGAPPEELQKGFGAQGAEVETKKKTPAEHIESLRRITRAY
jgi:hypothetical protein